MAADGWSCWAEGRLPVEQMSIFHPAVWGVVAVIIVPLLGMIAGFVGRHWQPVRSREQIEIVLTTER